MNSTPAEAAGAGLDLPTERRRPRARWWGAALLLVALAAAAWLRTGTLDLPPVPDGLTLEGAGLANLEQMKRLDATLWAQGQAAPELSEAATLVQRGIAAYRDGDVKEAVQQMQQGVRLEPDNLVLANAYRTAVFAMRRDLLAAGRRELTLSPHFPAELQRQPIAFFEELDRAGSTRETKLQLAMSWVDEMLLYPALEVKAPASLEAINLLTRILEENPGYVPALFALGLNHLHRPARLVWPVFEKAPRDIAAKNIGKCVAIGRRLRVGSPRLHATLAVSLGDAYVKAGRISVAYSWWQVAQNLCRDDDLQASIRRRYSWREEEILDRLEEELDRSRSQLEHPMTNLALMWN